MSFSEDMNNMATELLGEFDERTGDDRLAILRHGEKTWSPSIGDYEIGASIKYFLSGVEKTNLNGLVNGTTIQQGDELITCSTVITDESGNIIEYAPRVSDKMLIDGDEWSIVDTPHVNYTGNGLIICYKLQVRK